MKSEVSTAKQRSNGLQAVVGIGASAGGLDAVKALLKAVPEKTGMAFIVVQHTEPNRVSTLADILHHVTPKNVQAAQDGARLSPEHIYVALGDQDLIVEGERLRCIPRTLTHRIHMPIDTLFSSLSLTFRASAVGVVLSGTGNDGTLGLKNIKENGGTTFAQDEKSAKYASMPKSAISAGYVDQILSPEEIAAEIVRIASYKNTATTPSAEKADLDATREIIALLRTSFGVDFTDYKQTTISRRLQKRLSATKRKSLAGYIELLKTSPDELGALQRDLLINVTSFFRDPEMFSALETLIFPRIMEGRNPDDAVRIWVPGCSTGEEVYSLAISMTQYNEKNGISIPLQIFGTDISEAALEKARAGTYSKSISSVVSSERLKDFFEPVPSGYQVKKSLREFCVFARQNVVADPPLSRMDLISCRNVLIYLGPALQERVVPIFHYALKPADAFLVLGKSELVDIFSDFFLPLDKANKFYIKKKTPLRVPLQPIPGHQFSTKVNSVKASVVAQSSRDSENDIQKEADRLVLTTLSPAGVVVTENMDVIQFRGNTSPYLQPTGRASFNFFKMLHPDLLQPVRNAVEQAKEKTTSSVRCNQLRFRVGEEFKSTNVRIIPLKSSTLKERYFLVVFEAATSSAAIALPKTETTNIRGAEVTKVTEGEEVRRLTDELEETRKHLQSVMDERETSVEELQSANEEVTSSNEELQTLNQELETAKEELESSNEELTTLNEQLRQSMEQLKRSEERFRLLVSSVKDYAIFMLDKAGHIQSWNEGAQRIKGYSAEEIIGKHFSIFYPEEEKRAGKPEKELVTAASAGRFEDESIRVKKDGTTFYASVIITPLIDEEGKLNGYAKVTRDITDRKRAEEELQKAFKTIKLLQIVAVAANRASDFRELIQFCLNEVCGDLGWPVGHAYLLNVASGNPDTPELEKLVASGIWHLADPERLQKLREVTMRTTFLKGSGLPGRIWATGKAAWISDLTRDQGFLRGAVAADIGVKSAFGVPILHGDRVVGVMEFLTSERLPPDESLLEVLNHVGAQVGQVYQRQQAEDALKASRESLEVKVRERTHELEKSEANLQRYADELKKSNAELEQFAYVASHDLQEPLRMVSTYLQFVEKRLKNKLEVEDRQYIDYAVSGATRMKSLIQDLLTFAKIGRGQEKTERVDINSAVREAQENLRSTIAENEAEIVLGDLPTLNADPRQMVQLFQNLISNAVKYRSEKKPVIEIKAQQKETEYLFTVRDNGIGVGPEYRERIFEVFQRLHSDREKYPGTGIGLAICKKIVERHGGRIWVESKPGEGSAFCFAIPAGGQGSARL